MAGLWLFRRRAELAPFLVYFAVMFFAMGLFFTFHAPRGAFYHSAPGVAAMGVRDRGGRGRSGLHGGRALVAVPAQARDASVHRRRGPGRGHRAVGAQLGRSSSPQWDRSRIRDEQAAAFLRANAEPGDVFMASDPASIHPLTDLAGLAAPFDPFAVIEQVVDAYDVDWVVVLSPGAGETDPLNLWDGARGHR